MPKARPTSGGSSTTATLADWGTASSTSTMSVTLQGKSNTPAPSPVPPPVPTTSGCSHLTQAKPTTAQRYRVFVKYSLFQQHHHTFTDRFRSNQQTLPALKSVRASRLEAKRDAILKRIPFPQCTQCGTAIGRVLLCLYCEFTGCWKHGHIQSHMASNRHNLAVEMSSYTVYCGLCQDYVYSHNYEEILRQERFRMYYRLCQLANPTAKRIPTIKCLTAPVLSLESQEALAMPCDGIRGLRNMGSTCFMNVILQAFVHNPLLQTHFLSDPHDSRACSREACIACEMNSLFEQVFSGNHTPYGPTTFLRSIWQASTELSGYSQKDAHEFFITALNQIHAGFSKNERTLDCTCVVHQTFAGELQSTVTCLNCKRKTVANDPMLDISLDLRPLPKKGREQGQLSQVPHSLLECLQRFTTAETLGAKEYTCSHCGSECKEATKQLLIKSLPPVLSFQLKRFEHLASASKIESLIRIPLELDMTPYTTQSQSTARPAHSLNAFDEQAVASNPACHYRLFAVINHEGSLETGHYTMYALHRKEWFRFDDDLVTLAKLGDILKNKAYMCFYVRSFLDYSPA